MAITVKQFKGKGKYGLWTSFTDGYLTDPKELTREEAVEVLCERVDERAAREKEEIRKNFPVGWFDKDSWKIITEPLPLTTKPIL